MVEQKFQVSHRELRFSFSRQGDFVLLLVPKQKFLGKTQDVNFYTRLTYSEEQGII